MAEFVQIKPLPQICYIMEQKQITELHEKLMQTIIDYFKENNIDNIDAFGFNGDGLIDSIKFGKWFPSTDSSLSLFDEKNKLIGYSM